MMNKMSVTHLHSEYPWFKMNSLAPGRFQRNFRKVIFQLILVISCKIVLKWMPMELTGGKSTLVRVMAWCRQAASHYLSQCWPRSLSPFGVIRPQGVVIISIPYGITVPLRSEYDRQNTNALFCNLVIPAAVVYEDAFGLRTEQTIWLP